MMSKLAITAQELLSSPWMDLVDIRPDAEREIIGFIPGSVRVDMAEVLNHRKWAASGAVLVCTAGHRAQAIAEEWADRERTTLRWLRGGILRWQEAGLPVVDDQSEADGFDASDASSPAALVRLMRSCFVAEVIEDVMPIDDSIDPIKVFDQAMTRAGVSSSPRGVDDLVRAIDHLAASHRRLGGSMSRIAENVGAMRALTRQLRASA